MTSCILSLEQSSALRSHQSATGWCLSGSLEEGASATTTTMARLPFLIGRDPASDLTIPSRKVSKRHAEILHTMGAVLVRDLNSTNGTLVNGRRITQPTPVGAGDLLQFADIELQLNRVETPIAERTFVSVDSEQRGNISCMLDVFGKQELAIHFQPIVMGPDAQPFGYEALVRSTVTGMESPDTLFFAAETLGLETRLSILCRDLAVRTFHEAQVQGTLFLNTHPHEALDDTMIASLKALLEEFPDCDLVLEVHEEAVGDIDQFRRFKSSLHELGIKLAFDDFGVGQSRLLELAQVRPDFIKFDRSLVKDLGLPTAIHSGLVTIIHQFAIEHGIYTLAEGLESPESIEACRNIGFGYYQGYAFGRPKALQQIGEE